MNAYFTVGLFAVGVALGAYLEREFSLASQTVAAFQQVTVAQKGEATIITDSQTVTKDIQHDKANPCVAAPVPSDINKLLR